MAMALTIIGAATVSWSLTQIITALDSAQKNDRPRTAMRNRSSARRRP